MADEITDVPAAPAAEPTPPTNPAPWWNDLSQRFEDDGVRHSVDGYLRESWQPRMTKLEQDLAQREPAWELYNDLQTDESQLPAYLAVTEALYGPEVAQQVQSMLSEDEEEEPDEEDDPQELDPRVQALLEREAEREAAALYEQELGRVTEANPDIDVDFFHEFVIRADGDMDRAVAMYRGWEDAARQKYGAAEPEQPGPLGTEGPGAPTPPRQENYVSVDDAIDSFMAERHTAPAPIGSV